MGILVIVIVVIVIIMVKRKRRPLSPIKQKYEVDFDGAYKWAPGCDWLVVAGSYYRQSNAIAAMRSVKCHAERLTWRIFHDRGNRHDPNALGVMAGKYHVGYISRDDAPFVAQVLADGCYQVLIRKVYVGREGFPEYTIGIAIPREVKR